LALLSRQKTVTVDKVPDVLGMGTPVFNKVIGRLSEKRKFSIMDLGPANSRNIGFFSEYSCKLFIEDVLDALYDESIIAREDRGAFRDQLANLIVHDDSTPLDIILLWDIFNYLDKDLFELLMEYIAGIIPPGCYLHAFIYTHHEMSACPGRYIINTPEQIAYHLQTTARVSCPRYSPLMLQKMMPQFSVAQTVLLRNGIQEYLFLRK
jgi:hypothetical protein